MNKLLLKTVSSLFVSLLVTQFVHAQGEVVNPVYPYWKTRGNSGTDTSINFLGTTDNVNLTFRTNNIRRATIDINGNLGIGTVYPQQRLHIFGAANTAIIEGVGTGGSFLANTTTATDKILYGDAAGTVKGLPNGANNSVLSISSTTSSPTWTAGDGLFWKVTGNNGITEPAVPGTYGTSNIAATENWIGTIDSKDYVIGTNNIERMRVKKTTGLVGIGTASPTVRLTIQPSAVTAAATSTTYSLGINNTTGTLDLTLGSDASYGLLQTWNSKPMLINSQGNFVGVNKNAAPIQNLDVEGRVNVANGVIQRGTTTITATNDLGLYQQTAGNWIRFASNAAPIKFFVDQGGGNSAGTNALVNIENASGGGVSIGANTTGATNSTPNASAVLDLQSTSKGFFVPRMTTAQRNTIAVSNATEGLMIYNTDLDCFEWWDTKAVASGGTGFWNSLCRWCEDVYVYSSNSNGNNFWIQAGSPSAAKKWCVYVNAGVTLGASSPGGTALNFSSLPGGSQVTLYNYGTIMGGGGNGAFGGHESDAFCAGDGNAGDGQAGGDAIVSSGTVNVFVYNYGTIAGGGGGGGGGSGGCRARGGGGGGGRGTPGGNAGAAATAGGQRATGGICTSCTSSGAAANPGTAGSAAAAGTGGCGTGNSGNGCLYSAYNGGCGGNGGGWGGAGSNGNGATCGSLISSGGAFGLGGAAGYALRGNNGGSAITNLGGSSFGTVAP